MEISGEDRSIGKKAIEEEVTVASKGSGGVSPLPGLVFTAHLLKGSMLSDPPYPMTSSAFTPFP